MVGLIPLGSLELLVLSGDIGKFILKSVKVIVVDVDGVLSVVEGLHLVEDMTDILPLFDESLTLWGLDEGLIESLDVLDLSRFSPSLEGGSEVSDWSGVLDGVGNSTDIMGFLLDGSLSLLRDLDLEGVDSVSELLNLEVLGGDDTEEECKGEFHLECGFLFKFIKNIFA